MRYVLWGLLVVLVCVGIYAYKEFNRKPADLNSKSADVNCTATELIALYSNNEDSANKKFGGKIIEVTGNIIAIENTQAGFNIFLGDSLYMSRVSCLLDTVHAADVKKHVAGDLLKVRGICTGYLMDIELNRCVVVQ